MRVISRGINNPLFRHGPTFMQKGNKIILVFGLLVIGAGVCVFFEASSFQQKAALTEGKVVHVLGSSYKIQYRTEDGAEKMLQGSGKTHKYREGNSAKVWYRADNPDKARISDGKKGGKRMVLAGLGCVLLGIYPLFQNNNKKEHITAS